MEPATLGMIGMGIGAVSDQLGITQQMGNQKKMMERQKQNQMELNKQMQDIQQQNWDYTNYENQRKHMEKAGLNVGMMYGQGGGGGSTMGGGSGGSAQGGNVDKSQMGMMLQQGAMMQSQMKVNEASADKMRAEADNIRGAGTENTMADTALKNMNTANAKIQNEIGNKTIEEIVDTIIANRDRAIAESTTKNVEANVNATTQQSQINEINARALNEGFKMAVAKSGIKVNEASINKMIEDIKINKFNANTNQEFQGLDKVAGGQLTKLINWFMGATKTNPEYQRKLK